MKDVFFNEFNLDSRITIKFNPNKNCDVYLKHEYCRPHIFCRFADIDVANHHKKRIKETLNLKLIKTKITEDEFGIKLNFVFDYLEISHIYCSIKPLLGDEYPSLLLQLNIEQESDNTDNEEICGLSYDVNRYDVILVEEFNSKYTSKEQLKEIFEKSDIYVFFINDLIYTTV